VAGDAPAQLDYEVACDPEWITRHGRIRGWLGEAAVELTIARGADRVWRVNDTQVPGLGDCVDLDLDFTPATNLIHIRRLALAEGQGAEVRAAWLQVGTGALGLLVQRYERRTGGA
jgi:uncharacterized protein